MATYELTVHQLLARLALEEKSHYSQQRRHQQAGASSKPQASTPARKDSMDLVVVGSHPKERNFQRTISVSSSSTSSETSAGHDWNETEIDFTEYFAPSIGMERR
ncbi:hypothetical protein CERZMDRAFT_101291 [Cercospora zeae-maydis SCOH1-5]|uniref:Uncharacterized protein n=1 Tax=Cercospora zeae-maydis SCOH1-5 TaxID=717836 RepID=A0A6A6F423_9PEZI|nr:hypothetical protein CERZMDRAFT_101291 [Cercospora zeae-maydis SCOH1-5]